MKDDKSMRCCPACGSRAKTYYGAKNGFHIMGCRECGTLYTDRVPSQAEAQDYDAYYSESNLKVPAFIHNRVKEIISGFEAYRQTNNFLDIGFGAGTTLEIATELGWDANGLEVSKPAVTHALQRGFKVFYGSLRDANYPDNSFDVVTASEILEHLSDPNDDLREIVRILRPGGVFWGTTPSARAMSFRIMRLDWSTMSPPEHIQLYSAKGARRMLKQAGFKSIHLKTYGVNPMEIVHHFRHRKQGEAPEFSRVQSAYELNEALTKSRKVKLVKDVLNEALNIFGIGDSLKIWAIK